MNHTYLQGFASDQHIYRHSNAILNLHNNSTSETKSVTNYYQLCGKHKMDAYWILALGEKNNVIGTCCLGSFDPTHLQIYNFLVKQEHQGKEVEQRLFSLAKKYAKHLGFVTFVKNEHLELFIRLGGKVEELTAPVGHKAVVFKESSRMNW